MIRQTMKYGGAAAKVRSMYGRRLRPEDYSALLGMHSVREAAEYLRGFRSYTDVLRGVDVAALGRADLEHVLSGALNQEFIRIYRFMSKEDHPLLGRLIERAEIDEILSFLRAWDPALDHEYVCRMPDDFLKYSSIDFKKLEHVTDFEQFWSELEHSKYYLPLANLPRDRGASPEYPLAKSVMDAKYYTDLFTLIDKRYSGDVALKLKEGYGAEVDLLNIVSVLRIKTYFPTMEEDIRGYLLPVGGRERERFLDALVAAPDADAALAVVKASPYKALFSGGKLRTIDDYAEMYLYRFNKKIMTVPVPSVYTPLAYLYLKQTEVQNLVKIIECIHYGMTPEEAGVILPGAAPEERR